MSTIKSSVSETPKNFTNCTENVSCEYQYWSNKVTIDKAKFAYI